MGIRNRGSHPRQGGVLIEAPDKKNVWGYSLKDAVRQASKETREYWLPVKIGVTGMTKDGTPIPIDCLGKWVFGTPGYQGNSICEGGFPHVRVLLSGDSPEEAVKMIKKAVKRLK